MKTDITKDIDITRTLVAVRQSMGLSQNKMAALLKVSLSSISMWEQGRRQPPVNVLLWYLAESGSITVNGEKCPQCAGTGMVQVWSSLQGE